MNQNGLKDIKETSNKLVGRLQHLTEIKDDQKKIGKEVKEIRKLHADMEKAFRSAEPALAKLNFDKQNFYNAANTVKRACNQPSEGNIQTALTKMNEFVTKLAA